MPRREAETAELTEQAARWLRRQGIRVTPQRLTIAEGLHALSHPTAEELFRFAVRRQPTLSLATVYNTVERLVAQGAVRQIQAGGQRRYDMRREHHHHMRCRECGRLVDAAYWPAAAEEPVWPQDVQGWNLETVEMVWVGRCPECQAQAARRRAQAGGLE